MEAAAAVTHRRPLLTAAHGRLSGWQAWYDNAKGIAAFRHKYRAFTETVADGCAFWAATHGPRERLQRLPPASSFSLTPPDEENRLDGIS
jgi:hypothetical protein